MEYKMLIREFAASLGERLATSSDPHADFTAGFKSFQAKVGFFKSSLGLVMNVPEKVRQGVDAFCLRHNEISRDKPIALLIGELSDKLSLMDNDYARIMEEALTSLSVELSART